MKPLIYMISILLICSYAYAGDVVVEYENLNIYTDDTISVLNNELRRRRQTAANIDESVTVLATTAADLVASQGKVKVSSTDTMEYLESKVDYSIVISGNTVILSGDVETPSVRQYYGTSGTTVKGFHDFLPTTYNSTYSGDNTASQAITGVGFRPTYVRIWYPNVVEGAALIYWETWTTLVANASAIEYTLASGPIYKDNAIIAFSDDGFTVDDGGTDRQPNKTGETYTFTCRR